MPRFIVLVRFAWQTAAASASAAWSGRGSWSSASTLRTMYMTWRLSAAPVPTTACLICMGVYSPTESPAFAHATMAAPRAWAVATADLTFSPKYTVSMASSVGP